MKEPINNSVDGGLSFNPANPTAEKKESANLRWLPRKGPRGLILVGPLSGESSFVYSARGVEKGELWNVKKG